MRLRLLFAAALTVVCVSPASALADGSSAALTDQFDHAVAVEQAAPAAENSAVDLPETGSDDAAFELPEGKTLTMGLPAQGDASGTADTAVFDGTALSTGLAVQSTADGLRALISIDAPDAPERYTFPIGGDVASLSPQVDGGVLALDAAGEPIAHLAAPWARDANGRDVPTRFEIDGTTVVQVIEHRGGSFAYGITADPFWSSAWKVAKCAASVAAIAWAGSKAYKIIRELGGAWNAARLLVGAGNIHDFLATVGSAGVALIGFDSVRKNCF